MPLESVTQIRRAGGNANPYGYTFVVAYRLTFVKPSFLSKEDWPGADPVDCFRQFEFNSIDGQTTGLYRYPNLYTSDKGAATSTVPMSDDNKWSDFDETGDRCERARIVNMRILRRVTPAAGPASTGRDIWEVECTYEYRVGGEFVNTRVVPFFVPEQKPITYGEFVGFYNRQPSIEDSTHHSEDKNKWDKVNVVNRNLTDSEGNPRTKPMPICNSAMVPYLPQIKQTRFKQAYRYSWTSQIRLNFDDYINTVNDAEFTLKGYNGNKADLISTPQEENLLPNQRGHNSSDFETKANIVTIFSKKFEANTLLLQSVDCKLKRWRGRSMYEYTLVFLYDPDDEHDVFILDEGKEAHAIEPQTGDGWGGIAEKEYHVRDSEGASQYIDMQNRSEHVQVPNTNGVPPRETDLLDGMGRRLGWRTDNAYAGGVLFSDAVWLRYKVYRSATWGQCKVDIRVNDEDTTLFVPWGSRAAEDGYNGPYGYTLIEPITHTDTDCGETESQY